jgi:mannose-1-phosphate guanylyltransferase
MYVVIMAGGGGTRLRPLSRADRPKPFLPLLGEETLFQRTVRRMGSLVEPSDIHCVTDRRYEQLVRDQAPDIGVVVEPSGRNTAAAVALAATAIDRPADEVMLVLPADHWIEDEAAFVEVLRIAVERLATGVFGIDAPLVTLGIRPTHPSSDYGYLRPDVGRGDEVGGLAAYPLMGFEEKPVPARARELLAVPGVAWNAGMFAWQRGAILDALERYTSLVTLVGSAIGSPVALAGAYERIRPVSIDVAVMEGAAADRRVVMAAMEVGWSDVGSWSALLAALAPGRLRGAGGRVVEAGETVRTGPADLLIRQIDGSPAVEAPGEGTITADAVWAHLTDARHLVDEIRSLLDRVHQQESRT